MFKRLVAGVATVVAVLFSVALPASAQYADPATLTSSDGGSCTPGTVVTFTVDGAAPGTDVTFTFSPDPTVVLGIATADADGLAVLQAAWPVNASTGPHSVTATGLEGEPEGGPIPLELTFAVDCAPAAAGSLPRTGADSLPWLRVGLVLVALGGIILLTSRKRYAVVRETV